MMHFLLIYETITKGFSLAELPPNNPVHTITIPAYYINAIYESMDIFPL